MDALVGQLVGILGHGVGPSARGINFGLHIHFDRHLAGPLVHFGLGPRRSRLVDFLRRSHRGEVVFLFKVPTYLFPPSIRLPHIYGVPIEVDTVRQYMNVIVIGVLVAVRDPCGFAESHLVDVLLGYGLPGLVIELFAVGQ